MAAAVPSRMAAAVPSRMAAAVPSRMAAAVPSRRPAARAWPADGAALAAPSCPSVRAHRHAKPFCCCCSVLRRVGTAAVGTPCPFLRHTVPRRGGAGSAATPGAGMGGRAGRCEATGRRASDVPGDGRPPGGVARRWQELPGGASRREEAQADEGGNARALPAPRPPTPRPAPYLP
eukprot:gene16397-biopygen5032